MTGLIVERLACSDDVSGSGWRIAVYPPIATNNPVESHERLIFVTPNLTLRKIWKSSAMDSDV